MPNAPEPGAYRILDGHSVRQFIAAQGALAAKLGGGPADWQVREVGDGNLNLVFLIDGVAGTVCVKQALPYVRAAGPSWPMSTERAFFENAYYRSVAGYVGSRIPEIYHYDPQLYCTVMERLSPHIILRQGLIAGMRYPRLAEDLGEYVARACFFTSDFAQPCERKMAGVALFARNQALTRISVDLIFCDPYHASARNRHSSPYLDGLVAQLRTDARLKLAVARMGRKFLTQHEALLHGDLHSGSIMVTPEETRVIDPEFAVYGPIGFDLGAFLGNLLLNWYAQSGHSTRADDRVEQRAWILAQARRFWEVFRATFLTLWSTQAGGDAYPAAMFADPAEAEHLDAARGAYLDAVFADMLGFAACKMIRRILGFAHVADFDSIPDVSRRAACEEGALRLAHRLLTRPAQFRSIDAVIGALT
jgi:5-methylthioribose kinase